MERNPVWIITGNYWRTKHDIETELSNYRAWQFVVDMPDPYAIEKPVIKIRARIFINSKGYEAEKIWDELAWSQIGTERLCEFTVRDLAQYVITIITDKANH